MPASEPDRDLDWVRARVLNVVGHELRTPVTTVRGLADLLGTGQLDPVRQAEVVDGLRRNARRLEELLDDLLAASEVVTALPVGPPVEVPLGELTAEVWADLGRSSFELVVDSSLSALTVRARAHAVRRLMTCVLDNAARYGSRPVRVDAASGDGQVEVSVESPGEILPTTDVQEAFEPFWRGERAVTTSPGLGLGLPVARALARNEGGEVTMRARVGGGVITTIRLSA